MRKSSNMLKRALRARRLIEKPEWWMQYCAYTRDSNHKHGMRCLLGAVYNARTDRVDPRTPEELQAVEQLATIINRNYPGKYSYPEESPYNTAYNVISTFNDDSSHEQVLAVLDEFIAACE